MLCINFLGFILGYGDEDMSPPKGSEAACIPLYKGDRTYDQLSQQERDCYTQKTQGDCEGDHHQGKCFWAKPL